MLTNINYNYTKNLQLAENKKKNRNYFILKTISNRKKTMIFLESTHENHTDTLKKFLKLCYVI